MRTVGASGQRFHPRPQAESRANYPDAP